MDTERSFIRCPECLRALPHHSLKCPVYREQRRNILKGIAVGGLTAASLALAGIPSIAKEAHAVSAPSIGSTVEPGSMETLANYVFYKDGTTNLARNGQTGVNEYSAADNSTAMATIVQNAVNAVSASGGGIIFFKNGRYKIPITSQASPLVLTIPSNVALIGENRDSTIIEFTNSFGAGASGGYTVVRNSNISIASGGNENIRLENLTFEGFWVGTVTAFTEFRFFGVHKSSMKNCKFIKFVTYWRMPDDWTGASWAAQDVFTTPTNCLTYDNNWEDCEFVNCASISAGLYRVHHVRCRTIDPFDDGALQGSWGRDIYYDHCDFDARNVGNAWGASTALLNLLNDNSTGFGNDPRMIEVYASYCTFRNNNKLLTGERAGLAIQGASCFTDHCIFEGNYTEGVYVTNGIWVSSHDVISRNSGLGARLAQLQLVPANLGTQYGGTNYLRNSSLSHTVFRNNELSSLADPQGLTKKSGLAFFCSTSASATNLAEILVNDCQFIDDQAVPTQINGLEISIGTLSANEFIIIRDNNFSQQPTATISQTGTTANLESAIREIAGNISFNPQATDTVTAGASPYTYTNSRSFKETLVLTTAGGISALTYRGTAGYPITTFAFPFDLAPGETIVVTWATTAPVFTRYPR